MRHVPVWVAMALALTACTVLPGQGSTELSGRYDGWRRVAVDGDLRGIVGLNSADPAPHLYALAVRLGIPMVVDVTDGKPRELRADIPPGLGDADGIVSDGASLVLSTPRGPGEGRPAGMWEGSPLDDMVRFERNAPEEDSVRWWPLLDGEEDFRAVGIVPAPGGGWQVHAWTAVSQWERLDRAPLYQPAAGALAALVGTTEGGVVVAGSFTDRPDRPATLGVWSVEDPYDPSDPQLWLRHPLTPAPDGLTDLADWELGWWVAGYRDHRPVVYDFDDKPAGHDGFGAVLPVPDTVLDPDHPTVLIAGEPVGTRPLVLAAQATDGPAVWVSDRAGFTRIAAPPGRLTAARCAGAGVYVVIGGHLWWHSLSQCAD